MGGEAWSPTTHFEGNDLKTSISPQLCRVKAKPSTRIGDRSSKGCGHLKKESGCRYLKKEPRWQVGMRADARSEALGLQGEAYQDSASSRFLEGGRFTPPLPSPLPLSSLAIFKNHTQAEINPSNVITDLLKPDVERHLAVPSPGSVKRALQFSLVL